jgi:hypothetical protein
VVSLWPHPEGIRVLPDGAWRVGGLAMRHAPSLRFLKSHLVFGDDGAFLVQGGRRLAVSVEGPAFEVVTLRLDPATGEARAALDDGSEERVGPDSIAMNAGTGRFECLVRGGRARAVFSRGAHQALLDNVVEEGGRFALAVGGWRIPLRT